MTHPSEPTTASPMRTTARRAKPADVGKTAADWLNENSALDAIAQGRSQLIAIQDVLNGLRKTLKLTVPLSTARLEGDHLHLAVPTAAYAAKLKQLVPTIIAALNGTSALTAVKISRISFRPQPELFTRPLPRRQVAPVPPASLAALDKLRQETSSEAMKLALTKLIKRQTQK